MGKVPYPLMQERKKASTRDYLEGNVNYPGYTVDMDMSVQKAMS